MTTERTIKELEDELTHFLNWRCGVSLHTAREQVRVARRLQELPLLRAKFADGVLSYSKVPAISRIATPETEATLAEWAECATAAQIDKRDVSWFYDDDGTFNLRAKTGEATLDGGPVLTEASKDYLLCSSSFADIGPNQREVLYMGRRYRPPNRAQRRALAIRDGGCIFPGCTEHVWVAAHHLEEWEKGGLTDNDNLLLLCRVHHRAIHHRGFRIVKGPNRMFRFFRPDGIELIAAPKRARATGALPTVGASGALQVALGLHR